MADRPGAAAQRLAGVPRRSPNRGGNPSAGIQLGGGDSAGGVANESAALAPGEAGHEGGGR